MMDKKRLLGEKANKLLQMFPVVAIVGPRQCGKSTLVKNIRPDWKYYDLERPDDYQLITSDPLGFFSRQREAVIIDEAQQYPDLFKVLRGVIDQNRKAPGRFLLTGSSSPEIVKGLTESLAGRIATIEMWPFKAVELNDKPLPRIYEILGNPSPDLANLPTLDDIATLKPSLNQDQIYNQWMLGGYPEPRLKSKSIPEFYGLWMDQYFADYIRRDVQRLFPRINSHNFRQFILALSNHSGRQLNQSEIARALEVSSVTVKEYLEIFHNTFIWRNMGSYEKNKLKKVQKMPRGFFRDPGILHHLLKIRDIDQLLVHPIAGASFESFVTEEIIRGFQCTLASGIDFSYYRTKDRSEIDLIVDGRFGTIPIEIKLGHKLKKGALKALKIFMEDTGAPFGIVVNNAEKIEFLADNVVQVPAVYF